MDPKLRDIVHHQKLHRAAVLQIQDLLPAEDAALDAMIGEVVAQHDHPAMNFIVIAALAAGRPVDARHLARGTRLLGHPTWVGCLSWKMQGEVAEHLVEALCTTVMTREQYSTALLVAAAWSKEFRGGALPARLVSQARVMARDKTLNDVQINCLWALAEMLDDSALRAVLHAEIPESCDPRYIRACAAYGEELLALYRRDVMEMVPEKPDRFITKGAAVRRAVARIGRNDPCPCGSGRKYKRCCEEKDRERLRQSSQVAGKTRAEVMAEPEAHLTEAMLRKASAPEVARLDAGKVPERLLRAYFTALERNLLVDEIATAFEKLGCDSEELQAAWDFLIQTIGTQQRPDLARRMVKVRYKDGSVPDTALFRLRLLLAREDPARYLEALEAEARKALTSDDDTVLMEFAYSQLCTAPTALGIHCARSLIPVIGKKFAAKLLHQIELARDRLNLPPEEPLGDIVDKRFAEEVADGGKDAKELREARARLEAKAAEINQLNEHLEQLRRSIRLQEKKARPAAPAQPAPAEARELRDLRQKLRELQADLTQRNQERSTLRRELGQTYADLQALREKQSATTAPEAPDAEDALLLPGKIESDHSPRPIEFPRKFNDTLALLPRQVGRAALIHIGRIAAGDPTAFAGAIRLQAAPDVMRVRIGQDHRMLFRLLPDRVQLVDLINRRDLERCIARL